MTKMYEQRRGNISAFRGCGYSCTYCAFKRLVMLNKKCPDCAEFKPHFHPEALNKTPPKTKEGEFLTIGLSGDVSFIKDLDEFEQILNYCSRWCDRTFLIQSKNPAFFLKFTNIPKNVVFGTTIETNAIGVFSHGKYNAYTEISKAPTTWRRYDAMLYLKDAGHKIAVTVEPILEFKHDVFLKWLLLLSPEMLWAGYDSGNHELPEPALLDTRELVDDLRAHGLNVKEKLMRKAWWEA